MIEGSIRVICLGLARNLDGSLLFDTMTDPKTGICFLRPVGGGVEFGESIKEAIKREFHEEIGTEVTVSKHLATFENIFEYNGKKGHEIVFLNEVKFTDKSLYQKQEIKITEGLEQRIARWFSVNSLKDLTIYPPQVKEYISEA